MDQKDLEAIQAIIQASLQAELTPIKSDIAEMKADLVQVKEDVAYTRKQMDVLYDWVDRIDLKVKNLVG